MKADGDLETGVQMMAAMTETVGDRKLSDGRAPFSDHLSARGFNAETSDILDCSKTLVHDLLKVQPCETPKEQVCCRTSREFVGLFSCSTCFSLN